MKTQMSAGVTDGWRGCLLKWAAASGSLGLVWISGCAADSAKSPVQSNNTPAATQPAVPTAAWPTGSDERWVRDTVTYLASDYLGGRLPGTDGERLAGELIANEFAKAGLVPAPGRSDYFQPFMHNTGRSIEPGTQLKLAGKAIELKKEFTPLGSSAVGAFEGEVVFAGYGIKNEQPAYDDYAGLDVKGKVVLVMRYEPQASKDRSRLTESGVFGRGASLNTKIRLAADKGAAAVLLVNPPNTHDGSELLEFGRVGGRTSSIPAAMITADVADALLAKSSGGKKLGDLQKQIDSTGSPASFATGSSASGEMKLSNSRKPVRNVLAVLPGKGSLADRYVVVGAHYDHLGTGGMGSLAPNIRSIHNGADDNASGTTGMMLLVKRLAAARKAGQLDDAAIGGRSVLFMAYTAEEQGLIGSQYWVDHPDVPLSQIDYMINLDMIGRASNNIVFIGGAGTADVFDPIIAKADENSPLEVRSTGRGGRGPSDHQSFGMKRIPVLFFFTGLHPDYHRPTDDAHLINYDGLVQVIDMAEEVTRQLVVGPRSEYVDKYDSQALRLGSSGPMRVALGVVPDYASDEASGAPAGVKISGTTPGTAAERAGLKAGDLITKLNDKPIKNLEDMTEFLSNAKVGDDVVITFKRDGQDMTATAKLSARQ